MNSDVLFFRATIELALARMFCFIVVDAPEMIGDRCADECGLWRTDGELVNSDQSDRIDPHWLSVWSPSQIQQWKTERTDPPQTNRPITERSSSFIRPRTSWRKVEMKVLRLDLRPQVKFLEKTGLSDCSDWTTEIPEITERLLVSLEKQCRSSRIKFQPLQNSASFMSLESTKGETLTSSLISTPENWSNASTDWQKTAVLDKTRFEYVNWASYGNRPEKCSLYSLRIRSIWTFLK